MQCTARLCRTRGPIVRRAIRSAGGWDGAGAERRCGEIEVGGVCCCVGTVGGGVYTTAGGGVSAPVVMSMRPRKRPRTGYATAPSCTARAGGGGWSSSRSAAAAAVHQLLRFLRRLCGAIGVLRRFCASFYRQDKRIFLQRRTALTQNRREIGESKEGLRQSCLARNLRGKPSASLQISSIFRRGKQIHEWRTCVRSRRERWRDDTQSWCCVYSSNPGSTTTRGESLNTAC